MKFFKENRYFKIGLTLFLTFSICMLCFNLFVSFDLGKYISMTISILMPFIIGFALAYFLNPISRFFERTMFLPLFRKTNWKKRDRVARGAAIFVAEILALAFVAFLLVLLIPQLLVSVVNLLEKVPQYYDNLNVTLSEALAKRPEFLMFASNLLEKMAANTEQLITSFVNALPEMWNTFSSGIVSTIMVLTNIILGIIISFYALFSKEKFVSQSKKVLFAITPKRFASRAVQTMGETNVVFGSYITGTIIDSILVGILCFIGVWVMQMPYAVLIAFFVGVFNVIPFLGPFLGAIPAAFLILVETPEKTIWFIIFIFILQQFDGNILKPLILGGTMGLPSFWILFSTLVGGGLFGFVGMFLGTPVFMVIYMLVSRGLNRLLLRKNLSTKTADYLYKT